jgi:hypothetical protein
MTILHGSLISLLFLIAVPAAVQDETFYPEAVEHCLEDPAVKGRIEVLTSQNPVYLRGDFQGDGQPGYALQVRKPGTKLNGLLVCFGRGNVTLLGRAITGRSAFSDMPGDNFVASNWLVYSRSEIAELTKWSSNVPKPIKDAKGEAIGMVWEDGIALIYWDGKRYRWAGPRQ